jgi:hypothetical protein
MAPGVGGPKIEPPPRSTPFEGDVAIKELRRRLTLDPHLVPPPPVAMPRSTVGPVLVRIAVVTAAAVLVACGITFLSFSAGERGHAERTRPGTLAATIPQIVAETAPPAAGPLTPVRFVVEGRQAFANEPLPLGISLNGASGRESVLLSGLMSGTRLSAGEQFGLTGWRVPASEVGRLLAYAPRDFIGTMEAAVDLRSPRDTLVDSQLVRLEWVPKQQAPVDRAPARGEEGTTPHAAPALRKLEPEELALLLRRGRELLEQGDIAGARLLLRRAVDGGSQQGALSLGATYDPQFLAERGVLGFPPDLDKARAWYRRANELGSDEASRRIDRLARAPEQ